MPTAADPPNVFISYPWESAEVKSIAKKLATDLQANGIRAVLDQHDCEPGDQIAGFINHSVDAADWIICVCTDEYASRAGSEENTGVAPEARRIADRMRAGAFARKVIPLRLSGTKEPPFLKGQVYLPFGSEEEQSQARDKLVNLFAGNQAVSGPPIEIPAHQTAIVLCVDVTSFSDRPAKDQGPIIAQLWNLLAEARPKLQPAWSEVLPILDGVAILWHDSGAFASALETARYIVQRSREVQPIFHVRVGLHVGSYIALDHPETRRRIFVGSGLNDARRIVNQGDDDHILMSERFYHECVNHDPTLLGDDDVFPPAKVREGYEVFPHRLEAGTLRLYRGGLASKNLPRKLYIRDLAHQYLSYSIQDMVDAFADLMQDRFGVRQEELSLRATLWLMDPLKADTLKATEFRWVWEPDQGAETQRADGNKSGTTYSTKGEGEGPPGRAFHGGGEPVVLNELPDFDTEPGAYNQSLAPWGLTPTKIASFSRKPRTWACCSFPPPRNDQTFEPYGVVCFDSPHPLTGVAPAELAKAVSDVMVEVSDDLAMAWGLRT